MSDVAVEFDGVWKKFRRGERHDSLRDTIPALWKRLVRRSADELKQGEFWALREVSFQVRRGEALGLIGPNGAGKSTALKILSGILRPDRGHMAVRGRLSALIEVGAGFHSDLTGRENVYLNGAILGMTRREITAKFDQIVEFAGVADFIDTPVKRYSSGMQARLGFSVAAHMDPDVLLVDEVLAVGDMAFQKRCLEKMNAFVASGTTVIFVSHNMQAVSGLCKRCVLIRAGSAECEGPASEVITRYLAPADLVTQQTDEPARIVRMRLLHGDEERTTEEMCTFAPGQQISFSLGVEIDQPPEEWLACLYVYRVDGVDALCDYNLPLPKLPQHDGRGWAGTLHLDLTLNLLRGAYAVSVQFHHPPSGRYCARADRFFLFSIEEDLSYAGVTSLSPELRLASGVATAGTIPGGTR